MVVDEEKLINFVAKRTGGDFSKDEIRTILDAELEYLISEGIAEVE